mmetsp:Transcript_9308/g.20283  ORF Transcript_9308/g.20283 Transcript_9308/m.20283 type:complete len:1212 (-) Transcript_9308:89-3724(-)
MTLEASDDYGRHKGDRNENSRKIQYVNPHNGELEWTTWGNLLPGDLVVVNDRESFPADLILVYGCANDNRNMCYIETSGIDGETNLKIKDVPSRMSAEFWKASKADKFDLGAGIHAEKQEVGKVLNRIIRGVYEYEQPNAFLQFEGSFGPAGLGGETCELKNKVSLDFRNLILRGSELRNSRFIFGMIAYAGHETKLILSQKQNTLKFGMIDKLINKLMLVIFVVFLLVVGLADVLLFQQQDTSAWWYFKFTSSTSGYKLPGGLAFYLTFAILLSNMIPISMVLLTEILNKYMQERVNHDLLMYHEETDTPAQCRTASLSAEIGQITHFFSDKTGTLTRNEMRLVGVYIGTNMYGFQPTKVDENGVEVEDFSESTGSKDRSNSDNTTSSEKLADIPQKVIFKDMLDLITSKKHSSRREMAIEFLVFLATCHTVIVDTNEEGIETLNAESPDEEAFVEGASKLGVKLCNTDDGCTIVRLPDKSMRRYQVLAVNPFNSTRKRMSIVLCREDNSLVLFMKGADNKMFERVAKGQRASLKPLESQLKQYSWAGLRTLVMGKRELSEEEYLKWDVCYKEAAASPPAVRSEELAKVAETVESNIEIIGATAIEDQLQLGVPKSIQTLRDAGIQVWVLTGDKIETAINIGLSSQLLDQGMYQLKLVSTDPAELLTQLDEILETISSAIGKISNPPSPRQQELEMSELEAQSNVTGYSVATPNNPTISGEYRADCLALVVSGDSLEYLLEHQKGDAVLEKKLLTVARACKVVLACRVSPKQKALIVEMVRFAPDNKNLKRKPITLAIGDGANDVPMIQSAHVGIGISGREGRQAVNNSDFSIAQFRFVVRLLLIHGRENYRRHATVIRYLILCWLVYVFTLFFYLPYSFWSGQQIYYNYWILFTSAWYINFLIVAHGWFNTDLSIDYVMSNPWVYCMGAENRDLNIKSLLVVLVRAGVYVLLIWGLVFKSMPLVEDQEAMGFTMYGTIFWVMYVLQGAVGKSWTNVTFFCFGLLLILYFAGMAVFPGLNAIGLYLFNELTLAALAWTQMFLIATTVAVIEIIIKYTQKEFFPTGLDLIMEQDRGYVNGDRVGPRFGWKAGHVLAETGRLVAWPTQIGIDKIQNSVRRRRKPKKTRTGEDARSRASSPSTVGENALEEEENENPIKPLKPGFDYSYSQGDVETKGRADSLGRRRMSTYQSKRLQSSDLNLSAATQQQQPE